MRKLLIPMFMIVLGILFSTIYVVDEGTRGVVLRFNKIIAVSDPGLHFKVPGIDHIKSIDAKIQTTDSSNNQSEQKFITREKKDLIVDYYVQWKIVDFARYYEAISGGYSVENLLLARLSGRLRAEIGKLNIRDIITDATNNGRNSIMVDVKNALNGVTKQGKVQNELAEKASNNQLSMRAFGVQVVDVRIKQINFPPEVSESIYARMSAEREVVARQQRYQGIREAEETRAKANLRATRILSEAERKSRVIRGEGDAIAAKLYANAFNKDKEFFTFMRSLKAYEHSFSNKDMMIISPDSPFFKYMKLSGRQQ